MRARYLDNDSEIIVEMIDADGERSITTKAPDGYQIPSYFQDAFDSSCIEVWSYSDILIEDAFKKLINAMSLKGLTLEPLTNDNIRLSMTLDLDTGKSETRFNSNSENDQQAKLADEVAKSVRNAMQEFLQTKPDKLVEAIESNNLDLFMEGLTAHPPSDKVSLDKTLECVAKALKLEGWKDKHALIAARAAYIAIEVGMHDLGREYCRLVLSLPDLEQEYYINVRILIGNSYGIEGRHDTAAEIYKSILDNDSLRLDQETLAWLHHNLGSTLLAQINGENTSAEFQSQGLFHFRQAAEIRTTKGIPGEPAKTLGTAAVALERIHLRSALMLYSEIASSTEGTDDLRAQRSFMYAKYSSARISCIDLHEYHEALKFLAQAKPFIRNVHEDLDIVSGAMYIEEICYKALGDNSAAAKCKSERDSFLHAHPDIPTAKLELQFQKTDSSMNTVDNNATARLLSAIGSLHDVEEAGLGDKVEMILDDFGKPSTARKNYQIRSIILSYVGDRLSQSAHFSRALPYYLRATAEFPGDIKIRSELAACLQNMGRYDESLEIGLAIARDDPSSYIGFLIAGSSAYKNSMYGLAEQMLKACIERKPEHDSAKSLLTHVAAKHLDLVLQNCTTNETTKPFIFAPTTPSAFLAYLRDFVTRARMNSDSMWKSRQKGVLVENPENAARALLVQDLAAMSKAAAIYKESTVTGGRIDFIANVFGAEFIVELKICGAGYSKNYAEGGFEQLKAYLIERNATRGYLIVFDARAKQSGTAAIPTEIDLGDGMIAYGVTINIRGIRTN